MSDDRIDGRIDEAVESGRTLSAALLSLGIVERYPMGGADMESLRSGRDGPASRKRDRLRKTKPALLTDAGARAIVERFRPTEGHR